ncbi:hypothetical protein [Humibacter ginsenosidimutans]|uniref:Uncharacterized protein n=1 Tax=Humibacter ginsenosidimutans TaxID=2599293 RepID=A0A5B8M5X0_9MICO|nr:hypothetical protein [Humibacter ginsenosidimutans]QDZ15773.1 hypothetical protein FPZ11_14285 [Humibacter ginsenosidimutans]
MAGSILDHMPPQDDDQQRRIRDQQRATTQSASALANSLSAPLSGFASAQNFTVPVGSGSGVTASNDIPGALTKINVPDGYTNAIVVAFAQIAAYCHPPTGNTDWLYGCLRALASSTGVWAVGGEVSALTQVTTASVAGALYYPTLTPSLITAFNNLNGGYIEVAAQARSGTGWSADANNQAGFEVLVIFTR